MASLTTKTVENISRVGLAGITNDGDGLYLKVGRSGGSAMPWIELPAFMATLENADDLSSKALRFTILTGLVPLNLFSLQPNSIEEVWQGTVYRRR
ncbi:DUF4102 domain-containing protein [Pseudomonas sp. C1C7]|uniref:DUF4102 domain-containing protein n=1 Tax=Pseudomonas sp. C1C7 TaxID=2735272 RepID=UPI001586331B|nr:DUF4102 domain-containing protein [Pseudomonas sp. C1C7]NUT76875.1 DUF4102 domain-containing protein [Pseudomonas sp. C1C7]